MHFLNRRSLLQAFLIACVPNTAKSQTAEIATPLGRLKGMQQSGVNVFRGVPFAEPPVGKLRFRPPNAKKPWTDILEATTASPAPIQTGQKNTSEDCLYLNVFAPVAPGPHPVLLWIYGGGNNAGYANNPSFDGSNFARDGVVTVVFNYRVGALGFLELGSALGPDYNGSGNNAIKDQVQALRWVRQNIAAFGGDPGQVTIGGESAGGKNVAALMATPEAQGLFHRAVIESGSAQTVFPLARAEEVTDLFLKLSNSNASSLLTMPAAELLEIQGKLLSTYPANYPFRPVVDGKFLTDTPLKQIAKRSSVDLLIGTNRDESVAFVDPVHAAQPLNQKELGNAAIGDLAPIEAAYKAAFPDVPTADLHIRIITAEEYWIPSVRIAEARSPQKAKTFMYRFDHGPETGRFAHKSAHGSEVAFVWDHVSGDLAKRVHAAWVAFIKTGVPVADGLPAWPTFHSDQRLTMLLNDEFHVASDPNSTERQIWNNRL